MKSLGCLLLAGLAALAVSSTAHATNGMNMIAYDAVSAGMGGADAAVETGCTAVAANPANLSTLCKSSVVVNLSLLAPKIGFANTTMSGANEAIAAKHGGTVERITPTPRNGNVSTVYTSDSRSR